MGTLQLTSLKETAITGEHNVKGKVVPVLNC